MLYRLSYVCKCLPWDTSLRGAESPVMLMHVSMLPAETLDTYTISGTALCSAWPTQRPNLSIAVTTPHPFTASASSQRQQRRITTELFSPAPVCRSHPFFFYTSRVQLNNKYFAPPLTYCAQGRLVIGLTQSELPGRDTIRIVQMARICTPHNLTAHRPSPLFWAAPNCYL